MQIPVKHINFLKSKTGSMLTSNSLVSVSSQKKRYGEVLGVSNTFYVIPTGKKWIISEIRGSSSADVMGCKISLFYAPAGNDTNLVLIDSVFCNGNNIAMQTYYESPLGDGTRALMIKRERLAKAMINGSFIYNEVEE